MVRPVNTPGLVAGRGWQHPRERNDDPATALVYGAEQNSAYNLLPMSPTISIR